MIRVGVTQQALPANEFGARRDALDQRWHRFLAVCGIAAIPLVNDSEIAIATAAALNLQGIILTGGEDLAAYGGETSERDETERAVLRWALEQHVPIVGVCRGMQLIADEFGTPLERVDGHVGRRHEVTTGEGARMVNSFHQWAVTVASPPLIATAMAGPVVEALRLKDALVFGLMWHPEREDPYDPYDVNFFASQFGGYR